MLTLYNPLDGDDSRLDDFIVLFNIDGDDPVYLDTSDLFTFQNLNIWFVIGKVPDVRHAPLEGHAKLLLYLPAFFKTPVSEYSRNVISGTAVSPGKDLYFRKLNLKRTAWQWRIYENFWLLNRDFCHKLKVLGRFGQSKDLTPAWLDGGVRRFSCSTTICCCLPRRYSLFSFAKQLAFGEFGMQLTVFQSISTCPDLCHDCSPAIQVQSSLDISQVFLSTHAFVPRFSICKPPDNHPIPQ